MEFYSHPGEGKKQQTYLDHQHGTRRVISNLEIGGAGQQNWTVRGIRKPRVWNNLGEIWRYEEQRRNGVCKNSCVSTQLASLGAFFVYPQWGTPLI